MNKEITIYELLELIKDGKAPERIVYDNYIWDWTGDDYHTILKTEKEQFLITGMYYTWLSEFLNDKVEIINNKIGKLDIRTDINTGNNFILNEHGKRCYLTTHSKIIAEKVNELIDEIEKLKENHEN